MFYSRTETGYNADDMTARHTERHTHCILTLTKRGGSLIMPSTKKDDPQSLFFLFSFGST